MKRLAAVSSFGLFLSLFANAAENPYLFRKYHCEAAVQATEYLFDVYHDGSGNQGAPKNGKGEIIFRTSASNSVPMLIQDVAMKMEENPNSIFCSFVADFDLRWDKNLHFNLNIDACTLDFNKVKGIATVTGNDSSGSPQKILAPMSCSVL